MILESIVTTVDENGRVNIAPLGPIVLPRETNAGKSLSPANEFNEAHEFIADNQSTGPQGPGGSPSPSFCLRPYEGSRTCDNLLANGNAVIHVTDDALLIAKTAIGHVDSEGLVCQAEGASPKHIRLKDCHRWFAIEVTQYGGTPPRHEMHAECVAEGVVRPFFGFNRAKHAVIEAAIMATRIGLIDAETIRVSLSELRIPVDKTAGPAEREAYEMIAQYIHERLS